MRYFFANTEYHLLIIFSLIRKLNLKDSEYEIILIKSRFRFSDIRIDKFTPRMLEGTILSVTGKVREIQFNDADPDNINEAYFFFRY